MVESRRLFMRLQLRRLGGLFERNAFQDQVFASQNRDLRSATVNALETKFLDVKESMATATLRLERYHVHRQLDVVAPAIGGADLERVAKQIGLDTRKLADAEVHADHAVGALLGAKGLDLGQKRFDERVFVQGMPFMIESAWPEPVLEASAVPHIVHQDQRQLIFQPAAGPPIQAKP